MADRDFFTKMVYEQRQQERARKGLPPLPPLDQLPKLQPVGHKYETRKPSDPVPTSLRYPEQDDWDRLMADLQKLSWAYEWCTEWLPKAWRQLDVMEDQCRLAAENNHPQEYQRCRDLYLKILGGVCEEYFVKVKRIPFEEFHSARLGRLVRIYARPSSDPVPTDIPFFYARELPRLVTATEEELQQFCMLKEVFPGSLIV